MSEGFCALLVLLWLAFLCWLVVASYYVGVLPFLLAASATIAFLATRWLASS